VHLNIHGRRKENYYEGKGYTRTKLLPFGKGRYQKKIEKDGKTSYEAKKAKEVLLWHMN